MTSLTDLKLAGAKLHDDDVVWMTGARTHPVAVACAACMDWRVRVHLASVYGTCENGVSMKSII